MPRRKWVPAPEAETGHMHWVRFPGYYGIMFCNLNGVWIDHCRKVDVPDNALTLKITQPADPWTRRR